MGRGGMCDEEKCTLEMGKEDWPTSDQRREDGGAAFLPRPQDGPQRK